MAMADSYDDEQDGYPKPSEPQPVTIQLPSENPFDVLMFLCEQARIWLQNLPSSRNVSIALTHLEDIEDRLMRERRDTSR